MAAIRTSIVTGVAAVFVAGCGGGGEAAVSAGATNPSDPASITGTIRLYSYEDGFDADYLKSFHEKYPKITLETASFGSNEEAIAKIQAGFKADVINTCVDEGAQDAVDKGIYAPVDTARLENWDKIWPSMKKMPGVTDDGKFYVVPVDAGTAGLMYNADKIKDVPDSWTDLFAPEYKGRVALEDNAVTAIDVGALATGITDPLSIDGAQLESVKKFLMDNRGQFRTFWTDSNDVAAQLKSGEIDMSSGYSGTVKELQDDGVNVKFAIAKEGQMLWTCGYGISPDIAPENVDAAYALLNWYTSLPAQVYAAEHWNYLTSNQGIIDAVSPQVRKDAQLDSLFNLDNAIPASPPKDRAAWVKAWTEVKAS